MISDSPKIHRRFTALLSVTVRYSAVKWLIFAIPGLYSLSASSIITYCKSMGFALDCAFGFKELRKKGCEFLNLVPLVRLQQGAPKPSLKSIACSHSRTRHFCAHFLIHRWIHRFEQLRGAA